MAGRCFTVGVFQDLQWAARGLDALVRHGFAPESLSIIGKDSPELRVLIGTYSSREPDSFSIERIGPAVAVGPFVAELQGNGMDLESTGIARTIDRAGFQKHDGLIYERLTARGGVLIAVHNEPRAADALATLHAYGGGNAAIGAWRGRV
jgi:hypothetical protein